MSMPQQDRLQEAFDEVYPLSGHRSHGLSCWQTKHARAYFLDTVRTFYVTEKPGRISELENALKKALDRISTLESCQQQTDPTVASFLDVQDALGEVSAYTEEIFGGDFKVTAECDNEVPSSRHYYTFRVIDNGDLESSMMRYNDWHDRLSSVPENTRIFFRLSVTAK